MYDNNAHETLVTQSFLRALRLQRLERSGRLTPVPEPGFHQPSASQTGDGYWGSELNSTKDHSVNSQVTF